MVRTFIRLPPLARIRSSDNGDAERRPSTMLTSTGNSTTIAPMVAIPSLPWPKINSSTGAIATSGTERSSIAIGMNANSNGLMPALFASIRISVPGAIVGAMLAEWLSGFTGLGGILSSYKGSGNFSGVWAIVVVSVVTSITGYAIATVLESAALAAWGPEAGKHTGR